MTKIGPSQEFDFFVTQVVETIEVSKCDHGGNSSTDPPESSNGLVCIRHLKVVSYQLPEGRLAGDLRMLSMSRYVKYTNGPYPSIPHGLIHLYLPQFHGKELFIP